MQAKEIEKVETIKNNKRTIKLGSEKIRDRENKIKIIKIGLLLLLLFLLIVYFLLRIVYETGNFTVSLDENFSQKSGLVMYESQSNKEDKRMLKAIKPEFIDNISIDWLPKDINKQGEGSHNGDNYLAYSFYIENKGSDVINYWYEILVDDVIRNVDEAIRVMVYRNDERKVYAKPARSGEAEPGTEKFISDKEVLIEKRQDFKPGDVDKFTVVIFIEGDDPDCIDNLIGGEMKMHMDITEEHIAR